jgi:hypothetical protein
VSIVNEAPVPLWSQSGGVGSRPACDLGGMEIESSGGN